MELIDQKKNGKVKNIQTCYPVIRDSNLINI